MNTTAPPPRGDAPAAYQRAGVCGGAPPPTRRCAAYQGRRTIAAEGSSAHAEMRLDLQTRGKMRRRLLRPRGDAPAFPEFSPISDEAPPPTRRCALLRGDYRSRRGGSSAHAEMRPFRALGRGGGQWLLRPRGDAPRKRSIFDAIERAPPPTRRCALLVRAACDCARGSSAHAEMRPRRSGARRLPLRLLRPRGDAPMRTFEDSKAVAPPPTRRCARCLDERKAQTIGSSAHAEMRRPQRSVRARGGGSSAHAEMRP